MDGSVYLRTLNRYLKTIFKYFYIMDITVNMMIQFDGKMYHTILGLFDDSIFVTLRDNDRTKLIIKIFLGNIQWLPFLINYYIPYYSSLPRWPTRDGYKWMLFLQAMIIICFRFKLFHVIKRSSHIIHDVNVIPTPKIPPTKLKIPLCMITGRNFWLHF